MTVGSFDLMMSFFLPEVSALAVKKRTPDFHGENLAEMRQLSPQFFCSVVGRNVSQCPDVGSFDF